MSSSQVRERIAALRADAQALGELLAQEASAMPAEELFEVAGELQGVLNAGEGAQLVAAAHAASHETRLTERGPVEVHHEVGFIDAMAPTEVSLATGVGQWAAGRRVALGAALAERFPLLLAKVLAGELCTGTRAAGRDRVRGPGQGGVREGRRDHGREAGRPGPGPGRRVHPPGRDPGRG